MLLVLTSLKIQFVSPQCSKIAILTGGTCNVPRARSEKSVEVVKLELVKYGFVGRRLMWIPKDDATTSACQQVLDEESALGSCPGGRWMTV